MNKSGKTNLSSLLHRRLSEVLLFESNDPRFSNVTISRVDASGNLVFARSYYVKKFSRSGMNCPNNSKFFQSAYFYDIRTSTAIASHPTNENIIYFTSYSNGQIFRYFNDKR